VNVFTKSITFVKTGMMINRIQSNNIKSRLFSGKAIVLLGARQTGKTTLVRRLVEETGEPFIFLNCDEPVVQTMFEHISTENWKQLIGSNRIVVIDEAQRILNIGIKLKLATDNFKEIQLIVTGSSSLDLANAINEPLTGRIWNYLLYPISWGELKDTFHYIQRVQQLESRLVYGMYPEIITNTGKEVELLNNLAGSYLYKDLLSYGGIRKPEYLQLLLRALALQLGNEVSYNELSGLTGLDKNTVMSYISMLEQAYIIFRLQPLSRNLRNEISTSRKVYFYDNGIRNALISNFNPLQLRNDAGALWENFMISERLKHNHYNKQYVNSYFWRTRAGQEIDLIEESGGKFDAFEFKWNEKKAGKLSKIFTESYPTGKCEVIHRENFEEFI
jgi:predicted AAA+ superfamily ATPase